MSAVALTNLGAPVAAIGAGIVGMVVLSFGGRWLRKAILCCAGIVAMQDEELISERDLAESSKLWATRIR